MHLVPEKRTDKNGVTSTRWVKPSTSSDSPLALPLPQVASQMPPHVSNEELMDLMISARYKWEMPESVIDRVHTALDLIRDDDPSILSLAQEFLTTGNDRARSVAAEHLYGSALGIIEAIKKVEAEPDYYEHGWQAECDWGDEIKSALVSGGEYRFSNRRMRYHRYRRR